MRGIFSNLRRLNILSDVQVLVLDGLSVTADLVHDILIDPSYSVRILSLRECKHLNERQLRGALQYACRPSRPEGTPRLKGLYIFGQKEPLATVAQSPAAGSNASNSNRTGGAVGASWNARSQKALAPSAVAVAVDETEAESWYGLRGWQFAGARPVHKDWAQTLVDCEGIIAFDAVLCTGPRHLNSRAWGKFDTDALAAASSVAISQIRSWNIAEYSLDGCAGCGSAPEGWTVWGEEDDSKTRRPDDGERRYSDGGCTNTDIGRYPLLSPPPLHSASVRVAMCPAGQPLNPRLATSTSNQTETARFVPRCGACIRDRYCTCCHRWWCETCYVGPYATRPFAGNASLEDHGEDTVSQSSNNSTTEESCREHHDIIRVGLCLRPEGDCCWLKHSRALEEDVSMPVRRHH